MSQFDDVAVPQIPKFHNKNPIRSLSNPNAKIPILLKNMDDDRNQILDSEPMLDPQIKLFGKSIQLPETSIEREPPLTSDADVEERRSCGMDSGLEEESADEGTLNDEVTEHGPKKGNLQKVNQRDATSGSDGIYEKPIDQSKATTLSSVRAEEENSDTALPQEKNQKKPNKIIPCPRCESMDTKFCYFNNYNVNQPRYFCRKCQRYWTSGGTMRKLPVGAGRRKSKSSAMQYPAIAAHSDFPSASVPHLNGTVHYPVPLNGSVLSFAPDQHIHQICPPDTVEIANLASTQNNSSNALSEAGGVIDDNATGSAGSVSDIGNEDEYKEKTHTAQSYQSFQPQMMCYPGPLWPPFPWNPDYPLPGPVNIRPGFPLQFYPAPMYMGCAVPGTWNMPWYPPSSFPNTQPDPKSHTLGKHSRDDNVATPSNVAADELRKEENHKPSIWAPKTLRINDLEETAKSSMWASLGIKTDNAVSASGKGHFKPFSSLTNETSRPVTTSSSLLANPAALCRSMNFRESIIADDLRR